MDALNAKIKELTEMLDERNDTHQLLATQLKRLQVRTRDLAWNSVTKDQKKKGPSWRLAI